MKEPFTYLLEVLLCSGVLLVVYTLLLERRVKFHWCRAWLLATPLLAGLIPLLRIPVWSAETITAVPTVSAGDWKAEVLTSPEHFHTPEILCAALYVLGAVLILGLMVRQVIRIRRLRRNADIIHKEHYRLVRTRQPIASFSFFRSVYIWHGIPAGEMKAILAHEASHIAHHHTTERLAMECIKALLWWNPFVWIAARRLTETEEFEADRDVLHSGHDIQNYMNTIINQLFGYRPGIANGLRDSLTKKRFQMMTTETPCRHSLLRLAATLPAIIGLLCAFTFTTRAALILPAKAANSVQTQERTQKITVRILLGDKAGQSSSANKPAVGAIVKVVDSNIGTVTNSEGVATLELASDDILEVLYPSYKTVRILGDKSSEVTLILSPEDSQISKDAQKPEIALRSPNTHALKLNPIYIIDGIEMPDINILDVKSIERISVLKDDSAVALYGERAKTGVIVITTKNKDEQLKTGLTITTENAKTANLDTPGGRDDAFLVAETMPVFQGGDLISFRQWVQAQVKYPVEARNKNIQGRVVASFVVERDGSVSNIQILQTPDNSLSNEALRVLRSSPKWTPGTQRGETVRVKYTLPIDFKFQTPAPKTE